MKTAVSELAASPAVLELSSLLGTENLFEWIEQQAEDLAQLGRTAEGAVEVSRKMRRACGVDSIEPASILARAELKAKEGRYAIEFNPMMSRNVQRFSIAHEIGHTLWMAHHAGRGVKRLCATTGHRDRTIEILCDYFAAALLLPRSDVVRMIRSYRETRSGRGRLSDLIQCPLELIPRLALQFRIQARIAAWRLLLVQDLSSWAIIRVKCHQWRGGLPLYTTERDYETWKKTWYETGTVRRRVSTVEGYRVPFDTPYRKIPSEMVPTDVATETGLRRLDGRWWEGVTAEPASKARIPFRSRRGGRQGTGLAARGGDGIYVALDREGAAASSEAGGALE